MPQGLSANAQKQWRAVSKDLQTLGLLTNLDTHALALYCEEYAKWKDAQDNLKKYGALAASAKGHPMYSPFLVISNRAFENMRKMLAEFGMTPASRSKIKATDKFTNSVSEVRVISSDMTVKEAARAYQDQIKGG